MSLFLNQTKTSNCLHTIEGFSMKWLALLWC